MTVLVLPDAQDDLQALQDYLLERWSIEQWLQAEDEIFNKLYELDSGFLTGPVVPLLATVGIQDYRTVLTSHHRILYRKTDGDIYVYAVAGHCQDFPSLLLKRLFRR